MSDAFLADTIWL